MGVNDTEHQLPSITDEQLIVIRTVTIFTSVFGSLGNAITIAAILKGNLLKTNASFVFILNLNVCNLIHSLIFLPLIATQAFVDILTVYKGICNAVGFGLFSNFGTELWGYTLITINRYICVVHRTVYIHVYGNNKNIYAMLLFSWLFFPVIFTLPLTDTWGHFVYEPRKLVCYPFYSYNCTGFCIFVYALCILTTAPIIWFCYPAIIVKYVKTQRKVGVNRDKSTQNAERSVPKSDSEKKRSKSELKMAFTIFAVVTAFGACRLPFMIMYIYDPSMTKVSPMIHTLSAYLGSSSYWINPILYSLTNKAISDSLKTLFASWKNTLVVRT